MFSLLGGRGYTALMYRALAIAVLLAAAAFLPSLEAQMRTMRSPGVTARISVGPGFRAGQPPPPGRFGVMSPRHNLRFNIRFGNSCFTSPLFDPFFCQQFVRNRFLFAQPAWPYPYFYSDYGYDSEGVTQPQIVAAPASAPMQAPPAPLEPLLIEWQGDHFVRTTMSSGGGQMAPDYAAKSYSEKSADRSPMQERSARGGKDAVQPPRELPPAVLVFRDGHREEVSDYTIMNGTMYSKADYWTSGSWTKKIQIADLDVPATLKLNQERGLKFVLPAGPNEVVMRP